MTDGNTRKSGLAHCLHHDKHWEFCSDYDKRVALIKVNKLPEERALRLRLFQLVPDELAPGRNSFEWEACDKSGKAYDKAWAAYDKAEKALFNKQWHGQPRGEEALNKAWATDGKAWAAYGKAGDARHEAWLAFDKAWGKKIGELHRELYPDCPWDGETIFTRKDRDGNWY